MPTYTPQRAKARKEAIDEVFSLLDGYAVTDQAYLGTCEEGELEYLVLKHDEIKRVVRRLTRYLKREEKREKNENNLEV